MSDHASRITDYKKYYFKKYIKKRLAIEIRSIKAMQINFIQRYKFSKFYLLPLIQFVKRIYSKKTIYSEKTTFKYLNYRFFFGTR